MKVIALAIVVMIEWGDRLSLNLLTQYYSKGGGGGGAAEEATGGQWMPHPSGADLVNNCMVLTPR